MNQPLPPPPYGPPPGSPPPYGPPPGPPPFGPPPGWHPPAQPPRHQQQLAAVWCLGIGAILAVTLGISLSENGHSQWHTVHAWGGLAIVAAALTLTPAVGPGLGLTAQRAWRTSAIGAGAAAVYWVLFVLPAVGSNTSLLTSIGMAAAIAAMWLAPGRPGPAPKAPPSW